MELEKYILRKNKEWSVIDGEPCRVSDFTPLATVQNGKVVAPNSTDPYASITLECRKFPNKVTAFICHKVDFMHLWLAFKERGVKQNEEVIIFWTEKHFKKLYRILSGILPRLIVMICPKGAYELMAEESEKRLDRNWKPELHGEARFNAMKPIIEWKPEVMR